MADEAKALHTSAKKDYPHLHSWTQDPANDIPICSNSAEFHWKAPTGDDNIVLTGGSETRIEGWAEVTIRLPIPNRTKTTTLIFTSLDFLSRLTSSSIHFDSGRNGLHHAGTACEDLAKLTRLGSHWLVEHCSQPAAQISPQHAVFANE